MFSDAAETLGLGAVSAGTLALGILCPLLWIGAFVSGYFNNHFFSLICEQLGCCILCKEGGQGRHTGNGDQKGSKLADSPI